MKIFLLILGLSLVHCSSGFASSNMEELVKEHEERIIQLENRLTEIEALITHDGQSSHKTKKQKEPLLGRWDCTNGAYRFEVEFKRNGLMLQTESFLGNTKENRWVRRGEDILSLGTGQSFEIDFTTENHFSVEETSLRSAWDCERKIDQ